MKVQDTLIAFVFIIILLIIYSKNKLVDNKNETPSYSSQYDSILIKMDSIYKQK